MHYLLPHHSKDGIDERISCPRSRVSSRASRPLLSRSISAGWEAQRQQHGNKVTFTVDIILNAPTVVPFISCLRLLISFWGTPTQRPTPDHHPHVTAPNAVRPATL